MTPVLGWIRALRRWRDQYVDPQVRQLGNLVGEMRRGQVDVLFLGDSSSTFFSPDDSDKRRLPQMLAEQLGPRTRVSLIAGAGYNPELYAEFVRILATLEQRPRVVVLSMAVRTASAQHVRRHPEYGYRRSIETLRQVPDADTRMRSLSRGNRRTNEEFAAFEAIVVPTKWQRAETIGDYLRQVRGRRHLPERAEVQQALFDYLHGESVPADHPTVADLRQLGKRLRDYGVPVVHYWPPIPVEQGERWFPGEFEAHVRASWEVQQAAFTEAIGPLGTLASTPFETPDNEFVDSSDGSEHWNEAGRVRMAKLLAAAIDDHVGGWSRA